MGQVSFGRPKNENLTRQLVGHETEQNHMDVPYKKIENFLNEIMILNI